MRSLTARKLISALIKDGFFLDQTSGSHQQYRDGDGRRVTVSFHSSGDTFSSKTLKSMIDKQARWQDTDLAQAQRLI